MPSYPHGGPPNIINIKDHLPRQPQQIILVGALIVIAAAMMSATYQVEADEIAVVLRLGQVHENKGPGLHFRLPFGIDKVEKVPIQRQLKSEFGFRTVRSTDVRSELDRGERFLAESEMLTGDLNVGVVEWIVQYQIREPEKFLFNFRNIDATLRLMSEAAMRTVVGDHSVDELITEGREEIESQARELLSELNARYDTGIAIVQVKLQDANAPEPVRPALREVEEAKQERERLINDALKVYNEAIPKARGQALQTVESAQGYAIERTNQAEGNAARFVALYQEYKKSPQVTRTRLYLETLSRVLPRAQRKVVVDAKSKSVLPLLNLGTPAGDKP